MLLRRIGPISRAVLLSAASLLLLSSLFASTGSAEAGVMKGKIGDAVLVLSGPWRFHPGDDSAWARPEHDDSAWDELDLTPPPGSYDPTVGSSGFVPGWTAHGYPKLTGFAWYRLRVRLEETGPDVPRLALVMPLDFDDAYQVFVNGRQIGEFGRFSGGSIQFYNAQPRAFALPADLREGTITVAIRLWMDPSTPLGTQDSGGLHGPPLLGESSAVESMLELEWDAVNRTQIANLLAAGSLLLATLLGFTLFLFDRREQAYLWLAGACAMGLVERAVIMLGYYQTLVPMVAELFGLDVITIPVCLGLWALFWAYWFELENRRAIVRVTAIVIALWVCGMAMVRPPLYGTVVPIQASSWLVPITLVLKFVPGVLIVGITYLGIRKRTADGLLALAPILLEIVWAYREDLSVMHVPVIVSLFGMTFSVGTLAVLLMLGIISLLMVRRYIRGQRESVLLRLEIEQARQVQNVLIPEALPAIPGFAVESEYRPAQQVGGDFFQIMPVEGGGVLAVIGDVSGKGTPAAMTVSLLVGSIRTLAPMTQSPGAILAVLNERMIGRSKGGFTTCLVLRVDPDGAVTVANAGHLAPYLDGKELETSPALPLGLAASDYPESVFRLGEGEKVTLVTDGVPEARNKAGELLGFERTAAIAKGSAASIVERALEFGQNDDITVLTIARVAAKALPAMHVNALVPSSAGD